jgi:hypothetical protein
MTWRTIQTGDHGTVLCWHLGAVAEQIAADVPGWTVLLASDPSERAPAVRGRVALVGYSAGCQGVRGALLGPVFAPDLVLTADGTHDQFPTVNPANRAAWERLAGRARRGDATWIATCLANHTYVETIPVGQRGRAMATVHVLEQVTGVALRATCDRPLSGLVGGRVTGRPAQSALATAHDDQGLHLRSYHSATCDHAEHAAQLAVVLPRLWRDIAAPGLRGMVGEDEPEPMPATERSPVSSVAPSGRLPPRPLGERIADVAREYLARGVREAPGPATNDQIRSMLYPCRRGGSTAAGMIDASGVRLLGDEPADSVAWCAAFRSFCCFLAGDYTEPGDRTAVPHGYRCAVAELCADARARGYLRPASYLPRVGDAAIWTRAGGHPLQGGTGHVATVVAVDGATFTTIGGNESDAVRESVHTVGEPALVAFLAVG